MLLITYYAQNYASIICEGLLTMDKEPQCLFLRGKRTILVQRLFQATWSLLPLSTSVPFPLCLLWRVAFDTPSPQGLHTILDLHKDQRRAITTTADAPWIAMATARSHPISTTLCRQFLSVNGPVSPSSFLADPTSVPVPSGGREVFRSTLQVMGARGGRPTAASRAGGAESGTLSQFSSSSNKLLEGCQAKTSLAGGTSVPRTLASEPSPPKKPKLG